MRKSVEAKKLTLEIPVDVLISAMMEAGAYDRYEAMVHRYGEVTTKGNAADILSCCVKTINEMIADGRLRDACAGTRVDVRSIAEYIESKPTENQRRINRQRGAFLKEQERLWKQKGDRQDED